MPPPLPQAAPAPAAHPPAPEFMEVWCAGCAEALEVEAGLTEFICPDCSTPQSLPPELMPQRRRKRALPLPPTRDARLPCAACGAVLSVPPGLGRFACATCGIELAVDRTLLRKHLASAASAISVVAPPSAVALTSAREAQGEPRSQAIHVGQVRVERYSRPLCVEHAEIEHPTRATVGQAQQEHFSHSIHREEAHVEQLSESIPTPGMKKARFQVGPESVRVESAQVEAPNQVHHAPEAQRGPSKSNNPVHTDQARVQGHRDTIAKHGTQETGYAVEPSLICMESEQIVPLNRVVHLQQGQETPSDEIRAEREQVEPDNNSTGGRQKRKKEGLMSSANEGLHLKHRKRSAKDPHGVVDPVQQQAALPDEDPSHPPGYERISTRQRPRSLPQHQMSEASKQSCNVDLTTPSASSNPGISEAARLPRFYTQAGNVQSTSSATPPEPAVHPAVNLYRGHFRDHRDTQSLSFFTIQRQNLFNEKFKVRPVHDPKTVDWDVCARAGFGELRQMYSTVGLNCIIDRTGTWDDDLVRKFYANLHVSDDLSGFQSWVNGHMIKFSADEFAQFLGVQEFRGKELLTGPCYSRKWVKQPKLMVTMFSRVGYTKAQNLRKLWMVVFKINTHSVLPKAGDRSAITSLHLRLLFAICHQSLFDVAHIMLYHMRESLVRGRTLPYPHIVCALIHHSGLLPPNFVLKKKTVVYKFTESRQKLQEGESEEHSAEEESDDDDDVETCAPPPAPAVASAYSSSGFPQWAIDMDTRIDTLSTDLDTRFDRLATRMDGQYAETKSLLDKILGCLGGQDHGSPPYDD